MRHNRDINVAVRSLELYKVKFLQRNSSMQTFGILFLAILSEVIATTALKFSEGFSKLIPSVVVVLGYGFSFYLLSVALKVMPIGVAYAIWSGVGLILTVIVGIILWQERLDWARVVGIILILAGIVFINVVSNATVH
jgi:small multidrug resistance pump